MPMAKYLFLVAATMLTLTSEYALRAMIYLAGSTGRWPVPSRRIAEQASVPRKYLSSILADLVRAGILEASPGKSGGFRMKRSAREVLLSEVLAPFEPVLTNRRPCPFGSEVCNDDDPCAGHDRWVLVRETYARFLNETSVYDVTVKHRQRRRGNSRKKIE